MKTITNAGPLQCGRKRGVRMTGEYIPDPGEREEMRFEARLSEYVARIRKQRPDCTYQQAETEALALMQLEEEQGR